MMAINTLVQQLYREEEVGFVDLWGWFFATADMFIRDGLLIVVKTTVAFSLLAYCTVE